MHETSHEAPHKRLLEPTPAADGRTIWHHRREDCSADGDMGCPFHCPSLHPMIESPMHLREIGLIERICPCGVGHPDPDSARFMDAKMGHEPGTWAQHGCPCSCCTLPEFFGRDKQFSTPS